MTSDRFFKNINLVLDKTQTGQLAPEEIFPIANMAQYEVFGNYKNMLIENDFVHDALNPFRQLVSYSPTDFPTAGVLNLPANTEYITGLLVGGAECKIYKADEVPFALSSQVRTPTATKPVTTREGVRSLRFFPSGTYTGIAFIIRKPAEMVYAYTLNGREYVYNPSGSVAPEWSDTYVNNVFYKTLEMLSIILNDSSIAQYAMAAQKSTTAA